MKKSMHESKWVAGARWSGRILLWSTASLTALAAAISGELLPRILNADALLVPAVYDDLLVSGYALAGWKFPGSLYIYPDILLYAPLRFFAGSAGPAMLLFAGIQFAAFVLLWRAVLRACIAPTRKIYVDAVTALVLPVLVLYSAYGGRPEAFLELFRMAHHAGAALASLLGLYLTLLWLRTGRSSLLVLLFLNAGLSSLSDRIYLVMSVVPMLAALTGAVFRFRGGALRAGAAQLTAVVLMEPLRRLLHDVLRIRNFIAPARDGLSGMPGAGAGDGAKAAADAFGAMFRFAGDFAEYFGPVLVILLSACAIAALPLLVHLSRAGNSRPEPASPGFTDRDGFRFLLLYFPVLAAALPMASLMVGLANYGDPFQPRYLTILIMAPFFLIPLFVLRLIRGDGSPPGLFREIAPTWTSIILLLLIALVPGSRFSPGHIAAAIREQHPLAACLDRHAKSYGLKYGLSDYWNAKPVTLFSRRGLRVNQLHYNLHIDYWVNNFNWYLGREKLPEYDFLIMDRLNAKAIPRAFGEPAARLRCGESEIHVYNRPEKDARFRRQFTRENLLLWRNLTGND